MTLPEKVQFYKPHTHWSPGRFPDEGILLLPDEAVRFHDGASIVEISAALGKSMRVSYREDGSCFLAARGGEREKLEEYLKAKGFERDF